MSKPWSRKAQKALETLLVFYQQRDFKLPECPLCQALDTGLGYSNCQKCPWEVMTGQACIDFTCQDIKRVFGIIRGYVNGVKFDFIENAEFEKAITYRIGQLQKWIQHYKEAK